MVVQAVVEGLDKHILWLSVSGTTIDKILVSVPCANESLIRILLKPDQFSPQLLGLRGWEVLVGEEVRKCLLGEDRTGRKVL